MADKRRKSRRSKRRGIRGNQSFAPSVISGTRKRRKSVDRKKKRGRKRGRVGGVDNTMKLIGGVLLGVGIGMAVDKFAPASMKGKMLSGGKTVGGGR